MGAIGLAVLCGALGLAFLGWPGSQLWSIFTSSAWAQTEGLITLSEFIDNPPRRDDEARIGYIYEVNRESYEGNNLLPAPVVYSWDNTVKQAQALTWSTAYGNRRASCAHCVNSIYLLARMRFAVAIGRQVDDAQVNPKHAVHLLLVWLRQVAHCQ